MADLREAFSKNHALQCGYCTPGMLISSRDIVMRLPDADEARIRLELSGNLCRCTGYVGIVAAVKDVLRNARAQRAAPCAAGSPGRARETSAARQEERNVRRTPAAAAGAPEATSAQQWRAVDGEGAELTQSFRVAHARAQVWAWFADLDQWRAACPARG